MKISSLQDLVIQEISYREGLQHTGRDFLQQARGFFHFRTNNIWFATTLCFL